MATTIDKAQRAETSRPLATLHQTLLLVSLPFGILNFMLPIYGKQTGASAAEIGLSFSVFSLMTVLMRPLVGSGLDRFGRRGFFIAGLAGYGLSMVAFAYSATVWGLIIARVLQGAAASLLWLAAQAIVADAAGVEQRGQSFGAISQAANQGAMIGTFIGFTVLFSMGIESGWVSLFLGFAATSAVAAFIAWARMPETRTTEPIKQQPSDSKSFSAGLRTILRSRSLGVLLGVGLITGASSAMIAPVLMIFLQEKFQAGVSELAWAFFPSALVWTVLPTRLGKLADRFGRKPLMIAGLAVAALNSFVIPMSGSLAVLAALWVIEAVCFAASDPASQALITNLTQPHERGRVYGIFALAGGLGATIGPLAGGWLYDKAGAWAPFTGNAAFLLLCAVLMAIFLQDRKFDAVV